MGFFKSLGGALGSIAEGATTAVKEGIEKQRQFKDQYSNKSEDELFQLLARATKNKSIAEGAAIRSILIEHGYKAEDISAKIRSML